MSVEFIQYLRPNGRQEIIRIERPADVEQKAAKIQAAGYKFEIEELMNLMISMTVEDGVHSPIAHKIVANGPAVPVAVDNLVCDAFEILLSRNKVTPLEP